MTIEIIKTYKAGNTWGAVYTINGNRAASLFAGADAPTAESIANALGIKDEKSVEDVLIELGGKLWEKHDLRRVYLGEDVLAGLIRFRVTRRNRRGRITGAAFQGNEISNNYAAEIARNLRGKFWYDLDTKSFGHKDMSAEIADEIAYAIESL